MAPTVIVDDHAGLVKTFVELVEKTAAEAVALRGRFALAVTGGGDAQLFLPPLAASAIDWSLTHVFWGDERAVPPGHDDSNYGQVKAGWLDRTSLPATHVHRMPGERPDLEAAARDYAATMRGVLGAEPALDLAWLGVGPDGHVCSLFPGHPLLEEHTRLVAAVHDSPKPPAQRITLTLPALAAARLIVVTARGSAKADVVAASLRDAASPLPLARVLRGAARAVVLLDRDAAGATSPGPS